MKFTDDITFWYRGSIDKYGLYAPKPIDRKDLKGRWEFNDELINVAVGKEILSKGVIYIDDISIKDKALESFVMEGNVSDFNRNKSYRIVSIKISKGLGYPKLVLVKLWIV